jgi:hypothetical protein
MPAVVTPAPLQKSRKLAASIVAALVIVFFLAFIYLALRWPFSRNAVVKELEDESFSKVAVGAFHGTYFPRPGCVLEHVVFQHNPKAGTQPLMTIERIRIEGSFAGLFRQHVNRIVAEGMHILIPPKGSGESFETPPRATAAIDELVADGAILEVDRARPDQPPLKFVFSAFTLNHVGSDGPASFKARLSNPEPPGEISTTGEFGPWNADHVGKTAVSGEYLFQHADLGVFHGISGLLTSSGKFSGELDQIAVDGATDVPLFAVTLGSHQVRLRSQFHAVVNGENGDTLLKQVTATFGKTTVWGEGSVVGQSGQTGKTASLELAAKDGRIQDILLFFTESPRAPMSGIVSFKAKVSVPPGPRPFLEKLEMQGDFGVAGGSFTKSETQEGVNSLSKGAQGKGKEDQSKSENDEGDPETVLSDLKGHAVVKDGTARLSNLSFRVPGALAEMQGTYSLITEKIDLRGTLKTDAEVSKTTHGIKSLMLKVLDPFFKNKRGGYVAPVKITGTYQHPLFGLDFADRDDPPKPKAKVQPPASPDPPQH